MKTKPITAGMDLLTFYTFAAHEPMLLVIDWEDDIWHAGCMLHHLTGHNINPGLTSQIKQGPDVFSVRPAGGSAMRKAGRYECWKCNGTESEPWTP